jgi:hypothetical protein
MFLQNYIKSRTNVYIFFIFFEIKQSSILYKNKEKSKKKRSIYYAFSNKNYVVIEQLHH